MDPFGAMAGMGMVGALLAAGGAGGNALAMAQQYHYAKQMYQHRYQWAVKDLRKANLNPILASGSLGGSPQAISAPDYGGSIQGGFAGAINAAKSVSDINAQNVTNTKTAAEKDYVVSKTLGQDLANKVFPERTAKQLEAMSAATAANNARTSYLESQNRWNDALSEARLAESNSRQALMARRGKLYDRQIEEGPQGIHNYIVNQISPWNKELGRFIHSASDLGSAGLKFGTLLRGL